MDLQGTKRSSSCRMDEYFNTAKAKIRPLKSGSDCSCLLKGNVMKKVLALLMAVMMLLSAASCSIPVIGDFIESEESLGKTTNTAVAIASVMKDYLKNKKQEDLSLYGIELILNSDGNGSVKLYYTDKAPSEVSYSDITVAEVNSKTGHVERFSVARYEEDGLTPYRLVKESGAFDAGTLPVDSGKAITLSVHTFSNDTDFHYDYVQIMLSAPGGMEQYEVRLISMLNDVVYQCTVDAVSGSILAFSTGALAEEENA